MTSAAPRVPRLTEAEVDEFWEVVHEASWAHYLGQPFATLRDEGEPGPPWPPFAGSVTAAGGWCAPPEAVP